MKRILMVLLIAVLVAGAAFAAPEFKMSAGAGFLYGGDFGGGFKYTQSGKETTLNAANSGTGLYGFFDATYVEVAISFLDFYGPITSTRDGKTVGFYQAYGVVPIGGDWQYSMLGIGLLGKYPIKASDLITIFPAIGIDYRAVSSITNGAWKVPDSDRKSFDSLWVLGGLGLDFNLPIEKLPIYIRLEALYGIRLNGIEEKWEKDAKAISSITKTESLLGHGLTAKVAVGFKF